MSSIHRIVIRSVIVAMLLSCVGCSRHAAPAPGMPHSGPMLGVDQARHALIEMVERSGDDVLRMSLDSLSSDPAERVDAHRVRIGQWNVNLTERTFVVAAITPPHFAEWGGIFTRGEDGTWRASIKRMTRT
jgi:hypothetical protein